MFNKEKNFASAVVYVHNNEKTIGEFLKTLINVFENNFEHSEIICVNDYSNDDSTKIIKEVSAESSSLSVTVINMSYFHGLEVSMNAGGDLAIGDFVYEFDNPVLDFSEDMIMNIYRKSLEGYDIVSAVPDKKQRKSSSFFYGVFNSFARLPYKIKTESFRILSRRVINRISAMNKSVPYRKAIYANSGLKSCFITYDVKNNIKASDDKQEKKYRKSLATDSLVLFTDVGYKFSITMTGLMMLISMFMLVYTVFIYCTAHPVAGWTTTVLFLSIGFFGLFGILTVIIKYLQILVSLVFKRKQYSFESIDKLTK